VELIARSLNLNKMSNFEMNVRLVFMSNLVHQFLQHDTAG